MSEHNIISDINIKECFESIIPEKGKKEEIYKNILLEMNKENAEKKLRFSFFTDKLTRLVPYAAAFACLFLVVFIGFESGVFSDVFSLNKENSAETVIMTADTAEAEAEEPGIEAYSPNNESYNEVADDICIDESDEKEIITAIYTVSDDSSAFIPHELLLTDYDPLIIWQEAKNLSDVYNSVNLNSYSIDEESKIVALDFDEGLSELLKDNRNQVYIAAMAKTFCSFYPNYNFTVTVNSEILLINDMPIDFLN